MELLVHRGIKMNEINERELELLVKRILSRLIENQFSELKEDKQKGDNSFIFLEKSTLNILLNYILLNSKEPPYVKVDTESEVESSEKIERIIADNKIEFEEILTMLKEVQDSY